MRDRLAAALAGLASLACSAVAPAAGLDTDRINGDDARLLLGNGTGVVIGVVDSGINVNHPALTGTVTGGLPRLVAQANFVATEPGNTGGDGFGHGTAVSGQILSGDASHLAIATDARYINARVLDNNNGFPSDGQIVNGTGFALANGANLLNMSLGYFNGNTSGASRMSLMTDYITYGRRIPITVSAGNAGNTGNPRPQGPGDAYNVFSAASAAKSTNWSSIVSSSSYGPTTDGRNQPSIAAPGDQIVTAQHNSNGFGQWSGTSFAAPNLAGMLAAQMEYGMGHGLSTDPLVLKATMMNSATKINTRTNNPWQPASSSTIGGVFTTTSPLNNSAGVGQVDGLSLFTQYSAGMMKPGDVHPVETDRPRWV